MKTIIAQYKPTDDDDPTRIFKSSGLVILEQLFVVVNPQKIDFPDSLMGAWGDVSIGQLPPLILFYGDDIHTPYSQVMWKGELAMLSGSSINIKTKFYEGRRSFTMIARYSPMTEQSKLVHSPPSNPRRDPDPDKAKQMLRGY